MSLVNYTIVVGAIAFIIGTFLLISPNVLKKLNDLSAKMIARIDHYTFTYRIGFGVCLIIASIFLFFMAYYFAKRY